MSIAVVITVVGLLVLAAALMTSNTLLLSRVNPEGPLRWFSQPPRRHRSYPVLHGLTVVSGVLGMLELRHRVGTWPALTVFTAVVLLPAGVVMVLYNQRVRHV